MKATLIIKGILLYVTTIITMLFINKIESICYNNYLFYALFIILSMIYICSKVISKKEFSILSGSKFFFGDIFNDKE